VLVSAGNPSEPDVQHAGRPAVQEHAMHHADVSRLVVKQREAGRKKVHRHPARRGVHSMTQTASLSLAFLSGWQSTWGISDCP